MKKLLLAAALSVTILGNSQTVENSEFIKSFTDKLHQNTAVTNILFLGDSHIQAGFIPEVLRNYFQQKYGNAGRGLIFPYQIANSNGPQDFESFSNRTWQNFRSTYAQDIFPQIGAAGFVIGNREKSFIEIDFKNPGDAFTRVKIFADPKMNGVNLSLFYPRNDDSLKDFITKKFTLLNYQVASEDNFFEIASKFYTTTTRLKELNGNAVANAKPAQNIKVEKTEITYNQHFESKINFDKSAKIVNGIAEFSLIRPTTKFILQSDCPEGNIFYGFQFLNDRNNGIVLNTVGINGAAYSDFLKFPLQMEQLDTLQSDFVMISLGTNESVSKISRDEFLESGRALIQRLRKNNPALPILLISPTDNKMAAEKVKSVVKWIAELSKTEKTSFLNIYQATGGSGYFGKSLQNNEANKDGVHFLKSGYEKQAAMIVKAFEAVLK